MSYTDPQVGDLVRIEVGPHRGKRGRVVNIYDDNDPGDALSAFFDRRRPLVFNPNGLTLLERARP